MASGSSITITGGTNMTQVVIGDNVEDGDFNNARTNIGLMLGDAADVTTGTFTVANTYGWGQGGAGVTTVAAGETIDATSANGFKDLQDDKILVFDGYDTLKDTLIISSELINAVKPLKDKMFKILAKINKSINKEEAKSISIDMLKRVGIADAEKRFTAGGLWSSARIIIFLTPCVSVHRAEYTDRARRILPPRQPFVILAEAFTGKISGCEDVER